MIGTVIVTHGALGKEFIKAIEHIMGPQEQLEAVSVFQDDGNVPYRDQLLEAIQRQDTGQGVVVLTDLFGAHPLILPCLFLSALILKL